MTSMPASRSARAMTLAPRSCPSSPGFAMTTLSFRISLRSTREPAALRAPSTGNLQSDVCNLSSDNRRLLVLHVVVDSDDDLVLSLDRLLKPVAAFGDFLLRIAALDRLDHAAHLVDDIEVAEGAVLHILCELLDEVRPAQRVDRRRDA